MIYLGIDPGTKSAVTIMDELTVVNVRSINLSHTKHKDMKVLSYFNFVKGIITEFKPEVVYCEEPFIGALNIGGKVMQRHQAAKSLNKKLAVIELACQMSGIPCVFINPSVVKKTLTGNGRAEKTALAQEVYKRVTNKEVILKLIEANKWDETDSVAIALSGHQTGGI